MNRIEKLIKGMCPNGVEYKKIKEFSNMFNGMNGVSNKWKDSGNCKFIDYMNCFKNFRIDVSKIHNATVKKLTQNQILYNDVLFTASSETKDECCISGVIDNEIPKNIFLDDHLFLIRIFEKFKNEINSIFLNYYFHSISFRNDVNKIVRGLTRFYVSKIDFMEIQIPIPPIEIQNEIVKILDTFTQLEAELEAELEARDKQYQYYRNKLLDFDNNQKLLKKLFEKDNKEIDKKVKYKKLGGVVLKNLFQQVDANYISSINCESGDIKLLPNSNNYDWFAKSESVDDSLINNGEVITLGRARYANIKYWNGSFISSNNITITSNDVNKMLNKFLYYFLVMNSEKFYVSSSTYPKFDNDIFDDFEIPIPSLEIQTKIVNILDKLQDYSKNIKTGLPLEIEQRQKQYEYYRDLLLDFKANAQGGALANNYIELLNSIEQKLLYSIEYKYIQEICNISRGKVYSKQYIQNNKGIYPVYSSQTENNGELGKINSFDLNGEYVTWTTDGAYAGTTFYREGKFSITNVCGLLEIKYKNKINTKYLNYILINKTKLYVNKSMNNPKLMSNVMENIQIPIPSLEIQTKIVTILDKLSNYSKDIKTGLPLEIEERQKQYKYYRDLLLKF